MGVTMIALSRVHRTVLTVFALPPFPPGVDWLSGPRDQASLNDAIGDWTRYRVLLGLREKRTTWGFALVFVAWIVLAMAMPRGAVLPWVVMLVAVLGFFVFTVTMLPRLLVTQRTLHELQPAPLSQQAEVAWLLEHTQAGTALRTWLEQHPRPARRGELAALQAAYAQEQAGVTANAMANG